MPLTRFERTPRSLKKLILDDFPADQITATWVHIINNGIGEPIRIPILVARGIADGPKFGITAALHGNELNGMAVIQRLFEGLSTKSLRGTIIGVLTCNIPGVLMGRREFTNGADLNHIAPGKANGSEAEVYMYRLIDRVIKSFDYMIDLHTASFGRVNSYYVRADVNDPETYRLARLQNPEIILSNPPSDRTLRGAATALGIKAITAELRDPHIFQADVVAEAITGIKNIFVDLGMIPGQIVCPIKRTIVCGGSHWMYTDEGGILSINRRITDMVKKGEIIADVRSVFGEVTREIAADDDGIIIGHSINPINQTGSRIVHLGTTPREIPCVTEEAT